MKRLDPYLRRLGLTPGQACTLAIGIVLGGVLLATSVPPVWDRTGHSAPSWDRHVTAPPTTLTSLRSTA